MFKRLFRHRQLNADSLIIFIASSIAILFCVGIYFLSGWFYGKVASKIRYNYENSLSALVDSYRQTVELKLDETNNTLMGWYEKNVFEEGSSKDIHKYLVSHAYKKSEKFFDVFYIDQAGFAYSVRGDVTDIKDRDYYNAVFNEGKKHYVSGGLYCKVTGNPIFVLANAVYDSKGRLKGALCASLINSSVSNLFKDNEKLSFGRLAVLDGTGSFVACVDQTLINKQAVPKDPKYVPSSEYVKSQPDGKPFITIYQDEVRLLCVLTSIKNSDWKLALYLPYEKLKEIDVMRHRIEILVVAVSLLALTGLIFLEYRLMNYFERNRLIEANFDPITCIYTRKKFEAEGLKMIMKRKGCDFMLLETDIRGFKFINQTYGEDTANKLLAEFAEYTADFANYFNGVCGRGYADHFYTLFPIVTSSENGLELFKSTLSEIDAHFAKYEIKVRPKFGLAFGRYDGTTSAKVFFRKLISNAALAKTTIKDSVQETFAVCNAAMAERSRRMNILETSVETALSDREFFVMYQPKINLETGKISGAEALVRWNHPELGIVSPEEFIPLFEKNGFVTKIDFYVYEEVFKFIESRIKNHEQIVPISVNMSRNHDNPEKFIDRFMELFNKYSIPTGLVQVEILERSYTSNDVLVEVTRLLHAKGFSVAMDDFGSGESSLNMLSKVPVDVLKFDRGFLSGATNQDGCINKEQGSFIEGLIEMSHKLHKETVFEGVETEAQNTFLKDANCGHIQGYFYSKPLKESDFVHYLELHI